jgi:surface polysaccharide O-acyltransferase-like enzyme
MRVSQGEFSGSFLQFYPHYFEGVHPFGGNFAFRGMHLWYLMDLFLFSMLLLPLFVSNRRIGESLISRVSHLFAGPWALLPLFLLIAAASLPADLAGLGITRQMGSWDMLSYILFFILGYLIFSNTRIQETIRRVFPIALVMALVFTLGSMYIQFAIQPADSTMPWLGMTILRGLCAWCWIITILGFGSRFLNFNNRFLAYANEAILPFYILHQTVIVIIGFHVIQWNMGIAPKYFVIATTSFISIMAIYMLLVKRMDILRFLFGMRLKKPKAVLG